MLNSLKSLLSADRDSLSSKRLCGIIGWNTVSAVLLICTIRGTQAPGMVNIVIYSSTVILGVDPVTEIWKNQPSQESNINRNNHD